MTHIQQACIFGLNEPQAFISVNKNRVKNNNGIIYLNNGTEFEIEFYNYSAAIQKAVITINGKKQGDALVLRPGEHFYLDRFMDTKHCLKFDTYEVDDVDEVKKAIENNGEVKVEFYREYKQPHYYWPTRHCSTWTMPAIYYQSNINTCDTYSASTLNCNAQNISKNFTPAAGISAGAVSEPTKIETGRVEQGAQSNQDFQSVYYTFESYANKVVTFKLLPVSRKGENVVETSKIRSYCPQCGRRVKRGHSFCAGCGQDLRNL